MKIIAFAAQKGGSGKTTLAAHVAVQAELGGDGPVALIDTDPQGSLSMWAEAREAASPRFARAIMAQLDDQLAELRRAGVAYAIIDTPPAITSTIGHVVKFADLVVIPSRPSPHDLRAAGVTVDIAEGLGKPLVFVINGAHPRARITTQAVVALSQHGPLAAAVVHQRTDFAASMIDGRTVMELPRASRSAVEIEQLWGYLRERVSAGLQPRDRHQLAAHNAALDAFQQIA